MAWRAAQSLLVFHQQLQADAPAARPPGTAAAEWGLIADAAHSSTSDHAAKDFPGWGSDIVTAADFPNRPDLGLDAWKVLDAVRRSRDPRGKYGISNGQIWSNRAITQDGRTYDAYAWRPYPGTDKHYTHGHLSVVGDSRSDGTQPWTIKDAPAVAGDTEDDDMGASFGPIDILYDDATTSLNFPPAGAGAADPRPTWLNICNETYGAPYALRIWATTGNRSWSPLPGTDGGLLVLQSGQRFSQQLPKGTCCLSITRKAVDGAGKAVEPTAANPVYADHLTCCLERGAVGSA